MTLRVRFVVLLAITLLLAGCAAPAAEPAWSVSPPQVFVLPRSVGLSVCLDGRVAVEQATDAQPGQEFTVYVGAMPMAVTEFRLLVRSASGEEVFNEAYEDPDGLPSWHGVPALNGGAYRLAWGPQGGEAAFSPFGPAQAC